MYKVLYFTDVHYDTKAPRSRIDNYSVAILNKLKDIAEMRRVLKPDLVIDGGDLFHRHQHTIRMALDVASALEYSSYQEPIHAIVGNHLWKGRWVDCFKRSALKVLEKMSLIVVHPDEFVYRVNEHWTIHTEHKCYTRYPVPWASGIPFTAYTGPGNCFLVSDYHPFQGHISIPCDSGKQVNFVAPGAISRGSAIESDILRQPCAALLIFNGPKLEVRFIRCNSAAPGDQVLSKELKIISKEEQQKCIDITGAITKIRDFNSNFKLFDIKDALEFISQEASIEGEALRRCQERIEIQI